MIILVSFVKRQEDHSRRLLWMQEKSDRNKYPKTYEIILNITNICMSKVTKGLWIYGHFQQGDAIIFIYPQVFHFLCRISDLFLNTILLASTKMYFPQSCQKESFQTLFRSHALAPNTRVFPSHQRKKSWKSLHDLLPDYHPPLCTLCWPLHSAYVCPACSYLRFFPSYYLCPENLSPYSWWQFL